MTTFDKTFSVLMVIAILLAFTIHYPLNVLQAAVCAFRLAQKLAKAGYY